MSDHTATEIVDYNDFSASKQRPDPRSERTQTAVFEAVERLALSHPGDISVAEVVRESGISRSTFYAHFSGMEDLAAGYLSRAFRDIGRVGGVEGEYSPRQACRALIAHMVDTIPLYISVLGLPLRGRAVDRMVEGYAAQFSLALAVADDLPRAVDPELLGAFVAGGALAAVRRRQAADVADATTDTVDEVLALLPSWLF